MLGLKSPDLNLSRISSHVMDRRQLPGDAQQHATEALSLRLKASTEIGEFGVHFWVQVSLSPVLPLVGDYAFGMMQRETGTHRPALEI
jgi:hypothetical protein